MARSTPTHFESFWFTPDGSGSPPPPLPIPSGSYLPFIHFRRASLLTLPPRFRPVPARDLSAHVRRRTRPPPPFSRALLLTLASVPTGPARFKRPRAASNAAVLCSLLGTPYIPFTRYSFRMALLTFRASCIPLLLCSRFPGTLLSYLFSLFRPLSGRIPLTLSIPIIFKII